MQRTLSIYSFCWILLFLVAACGVGTPSTADTSGGDAVLVNDDELTGVWLLKSVGVDPTAENPSSLDPVFAEQTKFYVFADGQAAFHYQGFYEAAQWSPLRASDGWVIQSMTGTDTLRFMSVQEGTGGPDQRQTRSTSSHVLQWARTMYSLSEPTSDAMHPENNRWRLRPAAAETETELKARLANYVGSTTAMLGNALERSSNNISFRGMKGALRMYDGAVAIRDYDKLGPEWLAGFYDEAQAKQAYLLLRGYLKAQTYHPPTMDSWVAEDHAILEDLLKMIKADMQ